MPCTRQITNNEIRKRIEEFIEEVPDGTVLYSDSVCHLLNARSRRFSLTPRRIGGILKSYEELKRIGSGVWVVAKYPPLSLSLSLSQLPGSDPDLIRTEKINEGASCQK